MNINFCCGQLKRATHSLLSSPWGEFNSPSIQDGLRNLFGQYRVLQPGLLRLDYQEDLQLPQAPWNSLGALICHVSNLNTVGLPQWRDHWYILQLIVPPDSNLLVIPLKLPECGEAILDAQDQSKHQLSNTKHLSWYMEQKNYPVEPCPNYDM